LAGKRRRQALERGAMSSYENSSPVAFSQQRRRRRRSSSSQRTSHHLPQASSSSSSSWPLADYVHNSTLELVIAPQTQSASWSTVLSLLRTE